MTNLATALLADTINGGNVRTAIAVAASAVAVGGALRAKRRARARKHDGEDQ